MIVINPKYEYLHDWLTALSLRFESSGRIIYEGRNQVRIIPTGIGEGEEVCVKRFHRPFLFNRVVYTFFRHSKARRSYENALRLLQAGIATPEPIAYIEEYRGGLLAYSFLITRVSSLNRLHREFSLDYHPELDETIRPLARLTAHMHEQGILHLDFSPGNILFDQLKNGEWAFELIDLNRMRIGHPVSMKEAAKSLRRICAGPRFFETFANEYAQARKMDKHEFERLVFRFRNRFWHSVSFAITVSNEAQELDNLLHRLEQHIHPWDEIVVQADPHLITDAVREVIERHQTHINTYAEHAVNYDFAQAKNHLNSLCKNEYIFQLDADELPQEWFLGHLHDMLHRYPYIDLFKVPRINLFRLNERGDIGDRVAWPDWQGRVYRNNKRIHWYRVLHERIKGHFIAVHLPKKDQYALVHLKDLKANTEKWNEWLKHYPERRK